MKKRVVVWGEQVEVDVYQRSKTVWIARGEYNGKSYEGKASTPGAAAKAWADAAKYHSN
jgi:Zn-finger nucleic acid-binding protein